MAYFLNDLEERDIKTKFKEKVRKEEVDSHLIEILKSFNRIQGIAASKFYDGKNGAYILIRSSYDKSNKLSNFLEAVASSFRTKDLPCVFRHRAGELLIQCKSRDYNDMFWFIVMSHVSKLAEKPSKKTRRPKS